MVNGSKISAKDLLIEAKDLIEDQEHWCQGVMEKPSSYSPTRVPQYCARGALYKVARERDDAEDPVYDARDTAERLLREAAKQVMGADIATPVVVNDDLGHEGVMKMYDIAINNG